MRQESENLTRSAVCTPKKWQIITALIILTGWAFINPTLFAYAADAADSTAEEIVERAERIRFPAEGLQVDVRITTTSIGKNPEIKEYRILSKGNERTLLQQTTAPVIDRGTILLMRDHDLWIFLPNISQPVRLPLSQRLTGEVANGDLARTNYTSDYEPTLLRRETIDKETYCMYWSSRSHAEGGPVTACCTGAIKPASGPTRRNSTPFPTA